MREETNCWILLGTWGELGTEHCTKSIPDITRIRHERNLSTSSGVNRWGSSGIQSSKSGTPPMWDSFFKEPLHLETSREMCHHIAAKPCTPVLSFAVAECDQSHREACFSSFQDTCSWKIVNLEHLVILCSCFSSNRSS